MHAERSRYAGEETGCAIKRRAAPTLCVITEGI